MKIEYTTIGALFTPFKNIAHMPIQPTGSKAAEGYAEILPEFIQGLQDLEGFSHVILIYHFHRQQIVKLRVTPFLDDRQHGVFATRAPSRPNAIGLSVVKLMRMADNRIYLGNLDMLDGTPLLDIKPYVPQFDSYPHATAGWLENKNPGEMTSDGRFD